jgi:hypothetical protein
MLLVFIRRPVAVKPRRKAFLKILPVQHKDNFDPVNFEEFQQWKERTKVC